MLRSLHSGERDRKISGSHLPLSLFCDLQPISKRSFVPKQMSNLGKTSLTLIFASMCMNTRMYKPVIAKIMELGVRFSLRALAQHVQGPGFEPIATRRKKHRNPRERVLEGCAAQNLLQVHALSLSYCDLCHRSSKSVPSASRTISPKDRWERMADVKEKSLNFMIKPRETVPPLD